MSFSTLLIANRGEIAVRVIRTARQMGLTTVAVHSDADRDAVHAAAADRAVAIGGSSPATSYLRIEAILEAARASGAEAVHPGYGFLAENAEFADAVRAAGLVFVGPSGDAIRAMGDKAAAKAAMAAAGVPCVPGWQGEEQSPERLAAEAAKIGWPVMIKAVAGGGGRGMRLVRSAEGFAEALRSAKSEARGAFGDDRVLLEKAVERPRHVEIQVLADRHGNAVHLGERDCSVQRRHQKVIEEAPSPAVSPALRAQMGAAAVAAAKAIGYEGAGTLEFLLDPEGDFYFMEMNTRLQVEHPVTEAITGLDLVELQLRVAMGEPLPISQEDVRFHGHAVEVRLCAEDAGRDFMPASGRLAVWRPDPALRVDHALRDGAEIPPFYDSMIAKLVAWGPSREAARARLLGGLSRTVALGLPTNAGFLARALADPVFAAGEATTDFVGARAAALAAPAAGPETAALAALLLHVTEAPVLRAGPRALAHDFAVPMRVRIGEETVEVTLTRARGGVFRLETGGEVHEVRVDEVSPDRVALHRDGVRLSLPVHREGTRLWFAEGAEAREVEDLSRAAEATAAAAASDGILRAAMNGTVTAVHAAVGEEVAAGAVVVTVEAMKIEHAHALPVPGKLAELMVKAGDQVTQRQPLARLEV